TGSVLAADIELELPALAIVATDEPELEHSDFVDACLQMHGDGGAFVAAPLEHGAERRQLFHVVLVPGIEQRPDVIVAPARRAEEAELGGLADHEAELAHRQRDLAALLETVRDHAQGLDRRTRAGHRRHGGLDAEIERARHAAADAHAAPAARE